MGRSITPTYFSRATFRNAQGRVRTMDLNWDGRATVKRAEERRVALNESFASGGCNFHVSEAEGVLVHITKLEVIRNTRDGKVVAEANAPMFEVV